MACLADGFRDVDAAGDMRKFVRCLVAIDELADFHAYKEASIDELGLEPSASVADIACGLGFDLVRLHRRAPAGVVAGFDMSPALLDRARQGVADCGNVVLAVADAHALPCAGGTFDAVRIDRSLQHIADPQAVIAEMARITRPGGAVAASEPDWSTFSLGMDDDPAMRTIIQTWVAGFRNPVIGGDLPALFAACGLQIRARLQHETVLTNWSTAIQVYDVRETIRRCVTDGLLDAEAAERMTAAMVKRSRRSEFRARLTIHTVVGEAR